MRESMGLSDTRDLERQRVSAIEKETSGQAIERTRSD